MGITGLLPLLKSIHKPCNLKKFSGLTLGVDAYGWLHRGTVACAIDLALGKPTTKFVEFAMHRVRMLIHFGVTPYLVFDGDYLPSKAATEDERAKRREESKRVGLNLYNAGKLSQAQSELQKAVDVTPEMAKQLIEELKKHKIDYIVAPFEADSQLAYLEREGIINGIISEDSDLLVFGAKRLLTKLDQYGECVEINRADFTACRSISLVGWTDADFRQMAILSGCDYLDSMNNMGLKTAHRLLRKYKKVEKILQVANFNGKFRVPEGYLESFRRAELTFIHQRIFCPTRKQVIMATEISEPGIDYSSFLGKAVDDAIGRAVARGDLHPMTKQPLVTAGAPLENSPSPWGGSRKQTVSTPTATDAKPNKSIDSFFKPRRVPLAELDPNSFTPSPSQRRVQEVNSNTWFTSPLVDSPVTPSTEPSVSTNERRRGPAARSVSSAASCPPPKRQRLCGDTITGNLEDAPTTAKKSRFFNSTAPESSPSAVKVRMKKKRADINIWSDNSIDEALMALPDFCGSSHLKKAPVSVFCEEGAETFTTPKLKNDDSSVSVQTDAPTSLLDSQSPATTPVTTQQTSASLSRSSTTTSEELKHLLGTFTHQPNNLDKAPKQTPSQIPAPKVSLGSARSERVSRVSLERPCQTPAKGTASPMVAGHRRMFAAGEETGLCKFIERPSSDCGQTTSLIPESPEQSKHAIVGSEDCLIPCSEDEEDEMLNNEVMTPTVPKLNLGRFLYSSCASGSKP